MEKPYAPACDRNREPILDVLRVHFADRRRVLEIGSGTGQHAVHFASAMPHLVWQCSDRARNLAGIRAWLAEASLPNVPAPLVLDVAGSWPSSRYDAVFTANTLHIMAWQEVVAMFGALGRVLDDDSVLAIYGPFNYDGRPTSESNALFDARLREDDPKQGVRDFEAVDDLARGAALRLAADVAMPANNRTLVYVRNGA